MKHSQQDSWDLDLQQYFAELHLSEVTVIVLLVSECGLNPKEIADLTMEDILYENSTEDLDSICGVRAIHRKSRVPLFVSERISSALMKILTEWYESPEDEASYIFRKPTRKALRSPGVAQQIVAGCRRYLAEKDAIGRLLAEYDDDLCLDFLDDVKIPADDALLSTWVN